MLSLHKETAIKVVINIFVLGSTGAGVGESPKQFASLTTNAQGRVTKGSDGPLVNGLAMNRTEVTADSPNVNQSQRRGGVTGVTVDSFGTQSTRPGWRWGPRTITCSCSSRRLHLDVRRVDFEPKTRLISRLCEIRLCNRLCTRLCKNASPSAGTTRAARRSSHRAAHR